MAASGPSSSRIQPRTKGPETSHMLMAGSSCVASPSTITMVFWSSSRWGWVSMSKSRVIANRPSSIWPTESSLTGLPRIGSPTARSAVANSSTE